MHNAFIFDLVAIGFTLQVVIHHQVSRDCSAVVSLSELAC
jgi:hypothetical protein